MLYKPKWQTIFFNLQRRRCTFLWKSGGGGEGLTELEDFFFDQLVESKYFLVFRRNTYDHFFGDKLLKNDGFAQSFTLWRRPGGAKGSTCFDCFYANNIQRLTAHLIIIEEAKFFLFLTKRNRQRSTDRCSRMSDQ